MVTPKDVLKVRIVICHLDCDVNTSRGRKMAINIKLHHGSLEKWGKEIEAIFLLFMVDLQL